MSNGIHSETSLDEPGLSRSTTWDHQTAVSELVSALSGWRRGWSSGFAAAGPGLILGPYNAVTPDVIWISGERLKHGLNPHRHLCVAPEIIAEVVAPGAWNQRRDREVKLDLYSRRGVLEYWIVDWQRQTVDVYRRDGQALQLVGTLSGDDALTSPLLEGFSCPLATLWWTEP